MKSLFKFIIRLLLMAGAAYGAYMLIQRFTDQGDYIEIYNSDDELEEELFG